MDSIGVGTNIAQFEKVFEDLEVRAAEIDGALDNVYEGAIASDEVTDLLQEIQNEQAMKVDA